MGTTLRTIRRVAGTVLALAGSATAIEPVYVTRIPSNGVGEIKVVDLQTAAVVNTWPTSRNPRSVATSGDGRYVYVAAHDGVTVTDSLWPAQPVEMDFQGPGDTATDVAVSRDGTRLYVTMRFFASAVTMLNLRDATVAACLQNHTPNCIPGTGEVLRTLPFLGGEHVAVSAFDGSIWVMNGEGRVARAADDASPFFEVPIPVNQRPVGATGLAIGGDGNVAIASNQNCPMGAGCVKVIVPSLSNMLTNRPEAFAQVGGLTMGLPTGNGIPIFVALPANNQVARVAAGPLALFNTGAVAPIAVALGASGTLATINQGAGPNQASVSAIGAGAPRTLALNGQATAVASGPMQRGMLRAEPSGGLSWVYTVLNQLRGVQTVTYRARGFETVAIQSVTVTGRDAGNFSITANTCNGAQLAFGQTCQVSVNFRAGATVPGRLYLIDHRYVATLNVASNATYVEPVALSGVYDRPILRFQPITPLLP